MHEAAQASRDKGLSLEAAARPFVGQPVELDLIAGASQSGVCSSCYEMHYGDIKVLVVPDRDLDPIQFALFVEKHAGKPVHVGATVNGGAPGFAERSPLALRVLSIEPAAAPATPAHSQSGVPLRSTTGSTAVAVATDYNPHQSIDSDIQSRSASEPVELLHTIGGVVTVSSTVANNAHRPEHLIDRNLTTAWNSKTAELVGSWIAIELPVRVRLSALKLTVGFTASGPNGDDWFVMNHRVRRIRVWADQKEIGDFGLDSSVRDRQSIALDVDAKSIRIEILQLEPGSKKHWRETCISELEVWGRTSTPASGATNAVVRVDAGSKQDCPDKARLTQAVRARSALAKKGKVIIDRCTPGRFVRGKWYVTAAVETPAPRGKSFEYGQYFLFRGVLDADGKFVVLREDKGSAVHPSWWISIELRDRDGDGFEEAIEVVEGSGGVRYHERVVFSVNEREIKRVSSERLGEFVDGAFVPETP